MIPLSDRLIRPIYERFNPSVQEANMVQKGHEDMPLRRRVLLGKYFLLASLPTHAVEHPQLTNLALLGRFLHAKVDILLGI